MLCMIIRLSDYQTTKYYYYKNIWYMHDKGVPLLSMIDYPMENPQMEVLMGKSFVNYDYQSSIQQDPKRI